MRSMTAAMAAKACGGQLIGCENPSAALERIIIDSREVREGDLFAAFRGEKTDGHKYIRTAIDKGAALCLAEYIPEGVAGPVLLTESVQTAIEKICAEYRRSLDIPVVGITGSVGKTTAKEMIWAVLSQRFNTAKTEGNLNNQIGVPMTVSRIEAEHEAAVVEMGISGFGEMTALAKIAQPTMAVYTVIGHAHLEFLHDLDGVFKAKTEMLALMGEDAYVIYNGDDEKLRRLEARRNHLSYGMGADCDVRAENVSLSASGRTFCRILYKDRIINADIPAYGQHMVYAALEGAAVGIAMGLDDKEIEAGIGAYHTVGRRGAVTDTGFVTLVDDSYNANPDSMASSLDSLSKLGGRHVCILGDMLEMGEDSPQMHFEVGRRARDTGVKCLLTCGKYAQDMARGAGDIAHIFSSVQELSENLGKYLERGDTVLVKASRGAHLEIAAEAVKELKGQ